jgi:hypothetical protein
MNNVTDGNGVRCQMHASNLAREKRLSLNWQDNNVMHAKSGLRVLLEWKINRPDSVITDVMRLKQTDT